MTKNTRTPQYYYLGFIADQKVAKIPVTDFQEYFRRLQQGWVFTTKQAWDMFLKGSDKIMDSSKIKKGEVLSESQYYKVLAVVGKEAHLETDNGEKIAVPLNYVDTFLHSASQSTETKKITRTEMAEIMLKSTRVAMTVNFNKQVKEADIVKEIQESYENSTPKDFTTKLKLAVKKGLNGEERTMVGRHYGGTDDFGRVHFTDMEADKGSNPAFDGRQRLVDPRTLNWIIVGDVKYTIK